MTQLGLLHQSQTEAVRSGRDPAVGSPRWPPTPSLSETRTGSGYYPRGELLVQCVWGRRRWKARPRSGPRRRALQSFSEAGAATEDPGPGYPAARLRPARPAEHPCAASAAHTRVHTAAHTRTRGTGPAPAPGRLRGPAAVPSSRGVPWLPLRPPSAPPTTSPAFPLPTAPEAAEATQAGPGQVTAEKGTATYRVREFLGTQPAPGGRRRRTLPPPSPTTSPALPSAGNQWPGAGRDVTGAPAWEAPT